MKINIKDTSYINHLIETKETNIAIADMLQYLFLYNNTYKKVDSLDEYMSNMISFWQLDEENDDNKSILEETIRKKLKELNISELKSNPYYKAIKFKPFKENNYSLEYYSYKPYECFSYNDIEVSKDFLEIQSVGYYSKKINFPVLTFKNEVWMSITPNEIITMQRSIDEAFGDVLVFGLGLGYYPFMISLKDNINHIVIIEKDQNIIKIFKENIFPSFPFKEKISIVQSDAFDFILHNKRKFDYSFIDLWHSPNDGLPLYLRFKSLEKQCMTFKCFYWLERSIIAMLRRCYLTLIEENLAGFCAENYKKSKNLYDKIINSMYQLTKDIVYYNNEELLLDLQDENLIQLSACIYKLIEE